MNKPKVDEPIYVADNIELVTGLAHVRLRPEMYISSRGEHGVNHCFYEVISNSIDESMSGYCKNINIFKDKSENKILQYKL